MSLISTSNGVVPSTLENIETKRNHIDDNGEQTKPSTDNDKLSMNKFQCKVCYKRYKYQRDLHRHEKYYCGQEGQFACNFCDYRAKVKHRLRAHINIVHPDGNMLSMKKYKCDVCAKEYKYKGYFTEHQKYLCGQEGRFPCKICNYSATRKELLERHCFIRHTGEEDRIKEIYKCEACEKTYKHKRSLIRHQKDDCGQLFVCYVCNYKAKEKGQIKLHIINSDHKITDGKIKEFKCEACEKTYIYKRGLIRHKKYKCTQLGQFVCYICNYRAKEKGQIKLHIINSNHVITGDKIDKLIEDIKLPDYENIEIKQEQIDDDVDSNSEFSEIILPLEVTITEIKQEIKENYYISDDKEASLPSSKNRFFP